MQRINSPDGHFHAGDPSAGIKGTVVTRDFMEAVQEELVAIPESLGWKPDKGDNKQILKAIQKMFADSGKVLQESVDKHHKTLVDAKVNRAGDTMTGDLTLKSSVGAYSPFIALASPRYMAYLQSASDEGGIVSIIDKTGKIRNFVVRDNGTAWLRDALDAAHVNSRGDATVSGRLHLRRDGDVGELVLISKEGKNAFLRGRHEGGMEWINHAYGAVIASMDDLGWFHANRIESSSDVHAHNTIYAGGGISACEAVIRSADGTLMRLRGRDKGGGMFWVNNANKDVVATMDDAGGLNAGYVESRGDIKANGTLHAAGATYAQDGNVHGTIWGGWLRDWLNAKLNERGGQVEAKANRAGDTFSGRVSLSAKGWQADLGLHNNQQGQDSWVHLRARNGGGLEIINSAYNGVPWNVSDGGETWQNGNLHAGGAAYQTDGNISGQVWGGYLSGYLDRRFGGKADASWVNNKVDRGSQCRKGESGHYFGVIKHHIRLPDPWVIDGIEDSDNGEFGDIRVYGAWLKTS